MVVMRSLPADTLLLREAVQLRSSEFFSQKNTSPFCRSHWQHLDVTLRSHFCDSLWLWTALCLKIKQLAVVVSISLSSLYLLSFSLSVKSKCSHSKRPNAAQNRIVQGSFIWISLLCTPNNCQAYDVLVVKTGVVLRVLGRTSVFLLHVHVSKMWTWIWKPLRLPLSLWWTDLGGLFLQHAAAFVNNSLNPSIPKLVLHFA